jgi:hypothetical protein
MNSKARTIEDYQKVITCTVIGFLTLCIFLYVSYVYATIMHTAERQKIVQNTSDLQSDIGDLEVALIESGRVYTTSYAYEHGFADVYGVEFVERSTDSRLSYNQ